MSTVGLPLPPRKITAKFAAEGDAIDERMAQKAKEGDALMVAKRKVWDFQVQKDKQQRCSSH